MLASQFQRSAKELPSWSVAERTRLLELYTRGDILWETRAEELDKEFGKNHPPNFFTVQSAKYELHLIFRDPNPEHVNTGLPSHPRGKEAAEMWLKHYRKKLAEKREQAKQMLKIGMRKTLNLVLRYKTGQLPMVELMAMRDQQREKDAERPDSEKFEKNLQKFISQSHAEDLDYVTCLEDLLRVIKGDRLHPASPLCSPKVQQSPPSHQPVHQLSSAASSPNAQPNTPEMEEGMSLAEKLGFSPPNKSPTITAVGTPPCPAKSPLRYSAAEVGDEWEDQKPRGIDLPVGMGYRTPVPRNVDIEDDVAMDLKAQKTTVTEHALQSREDVKLDSPPSSGLRHRPSSLSPAQPTLHLISSPATSKKIEARKTSTTTRTRTRIHISEDEEEELSETAKKTLKSPTRNSKAVMHTEEDTSDLDSAEGSGSAKYKSVRSLNRRLRTTTSAAASVPTPNEKEVSDAPVDVGPSRKRGRTEISDASASNPMDAPPSKNLRRAHGSPPIDVSFNQLKQATADLAAPAQIPPETDAASAAIERDSTKRRASTRIQVLQKVETPKTATTSSATISVKQPTIVEDNEIKSVVDEEEETSKHVKIKKEIFEEEKSISSAIVAFKKEAAKDEEKSFWQREKVGKSSFSIGTQTNVSVRHSCVPILPITLKSKQTRGQIAPKLPPSIGTQTGQVEFASDDVLYIRPIGSTQLYIPVDRAVNLEGRKGFKKSKAKPAPTTDEDTIAQIAIENEKLAFLEGQTSSSAGSEHASKTSGHKTHGKDTLRSRHTKDSSVFSQSSTHHSQFSASHKQHIKVVMSQLQQSPPKKDKRSIHVDTKTPRSAAAARPLRAQAPAAAAAVKTILISLWKEIIALRNAPIFTQPVSEQDVPGYHMVVKKPMDLSTIRRMVDSGKISTISDFRAHILLMFTNAIMFNSTGHDINQMAKDMLRFCMKLIRDAQYAAGEFGGVSPPVKTGRRSQAVAGKHSRVAASPAVDKERAGSVASEAFLSASSFVAPPPVTYPALKSSTTPAAASAKQLPSTSARFKSRLGTRPTMFLNEEEEREQAEKEAKRNLFDRKSSNSGFQKVRHNNNK